MAVAGTETAKIVAERGGYVIEEASPEALAAFLQTFTRQDLNARRKALLARPATDFVATPQDVKKMIAALPKTPRQRRVLNAPHKEPLLGA